MELNVILHTVNVGNWQEVSLEQAAKLKASGLADQATITYCLNFDETSYDVLREFWRDCSNVNFVYFPGTTPDDWEFSTKIALKELCDSTQHEFYLLYLHQKGLTRSEVTVTDWRHFMEYWCIERWQDCVARLDQGWDTVGVNLRYDPAIHYSGDFFWTKASYVRRLKRLQMPAEVGYQPQVAAAGWPYRYDPEQWTCSGNPQAYQIDSSPMPAEQGWHYRNPWPPESYRK